MSDKICSKCGHKEKDHERRICTTFCELFYACKKCKCYIHSNILESAVEVADRVFIDSEAVR